MAQVRVARVTGDRVFLFEEDVPEGRSLEATGIGNLKGSIDFDQALATVRDAAESMAQSLIALPSSPTAVEITFGVKLSTEVGAIIAKAAGEANFSIKLAWSCKNQ